MKKILLIIYALLFTTLIEAQIPQITQYPATLVLGTWEAVDGDMTYIMVIKISTKEYPKFEWMPDLEYIEYRLIYKQGNIVIKDTQTMGDDYLMAGRMRSNNQVSWFMGDDTLNYDREIIFTVSGDTADWIMDMGGSEPFISGRTGTPDIPASLTFTKISDDTEYDSGDNKGTRSTDPPSGEITDSWIGGGVTPL